MEIESKNSKILCPTKAEVNKYLKRWEENDDLKETSEKLIKLFTKTYPNNDIYYEVWIKTHALNSGLNVHVPEIYKVAKYLSRQKNIEVEVIRKGHGARGKKDAKNESDLYSFATKYYSFHNQRKYPLFDSNVKKALIHFKNKGFTFKDADLKIYNEFVSIIKNFQKVFGLQEFLLEEIDKYLYLVGSDLKPSRKKK